MTPYRNQRLEPQKSLVRLVQMMIFLFKKKKWNFWGSFRNHRHSFFCPMFTHRSLLNWFSGMWNTRHSRGGKPLQGPWGVTPTTLFLRGWKERNRPHLWYHSKIFRSQKFRKVGWWEPFPQILLAWYVVLKKITFLYTFKNWLFKVPGGLKNQHDRWFLFFSQNHHGEMIQHDLDPANRYPILELQTTFF